MSETFFSHITLFNLFPSHPLPGLAFVYFTIHDDVQLFLPVCPRQRFLLQQPHQPSPAPPPMTPLPLNSHSIHLTHPPVSLSSISSHGRPAQVETRVVLSLSGFTHSRYYHRAPVSFTDNHLERAFNRLADNDGCTF